MVRDAQVARFRAFFELLGVREDFQHLQSTEACDAEDHDERAETASERGIRAGLVDPETDGRMREVELADEGNKATRAHLSTVK